MTDTVLTRESPSQMMLSGAVIPTVRLGQKRRLCYRLFVQNNIKYKNRATSLNLGMGYATKGYEFL